MKIRIQPRTILLIVFIILLLFVIKKQIEIVTLIYQRTDLLDAEPLSYGAKRYGIDQCLCIINEKKSIYFDKNGSKTIIKSEVDNFGSNIVEWDPNFKFNVTN